MPALQHLVQSLPVSLHPCACNHALVRPTHLIIVSVFALFDSSFPTNTYEFMHFDVYRPFWYGLQNSSSSNATKLHTTAQTTKTHHPNHNAQSKYFGLISCQNRISSWQPSAPSHDTVIIASYGNHRPSIIVVSASRLATYLYLPHKNITPRIITKQDRRPTHKRTIGFTLFDRLHTYGDQVACCLVCAPADAVEAKLYACDILILLVCCCLSKTPADSNKMDQSNQTKRYFYFHQNKSVCPIPNHANIMWYCYFVRVNILCLW